MKTDYQRSKCYAWEYKYIYKEDYSSVPFERLQELVDYIWKEEGLLYPPQVTVKHKNNTTALAKANRLEIWAPAGGLPSLVLLHEIAHSMLTCEAEDKRCGHGPRWAGMFMLLLSKYAGRGLPELMYTAKEAGVDFNFKGPLYKEES